MKSVKFLSLILMCATSSLALILPAIGVVSFPRQLTDPSSRLAQPGTSLQPVYANPQNTHPQNSNLQNSGAILPGGAWVPPGSNNTSILPAQAGFPISAPVPNMDRFPPSLANDGSLANNGQLPSKTVHKMGMGIWLVLLSIWFLALFVWAIAPTPGPSRR